MAEIASWSTLPPERRRVVMSELEGRKAQILDREKRSRLYRLPG
jgi:predicted Fe-S protein YdhL (DUF1289 family)